MRACLCAIPVGMQTPAVSIHTPTFILRAAKELCNENGSWRQTHVIRCQSHAHTTPLWRGSLSRTKQLRHLIHPVTPSLTPCLSASFFSCFPLRCESNAGFRLSLFPTTSTSTTNPCLNLLFASWTLNTATKFVCAIASVFVFAVAVEGLARVRHATVVRVRKTTATAVAALSRQTNNGNSSNRNNIGSHRTTAATSGTMWWMKRRRMVLRSLIPVLHGLQALAGYTLMLITMTFSVELLCAVVSGLAVGYAIFFRLSDNNNHNSDDNDDRLLLRQHVTTNPCCEFMQEETVESFVRETAAVVVGASESEPLLSNNNDDEEETTVL